MTDEQHADPPAATGVQDEQPEPGPPMAAETDSAVTLEPVAPAPADSVLPLSPPDSTGPEIVAPPPDYSAAGVPSLDFVRDKIEGRYARSLGSTELAQETPEARSFEEQAAKREEAAQEKLAAIRRSLRDGPS